MPNEQKIRAIVRQEILKHGDKTTFSSFQVNKHIHNGSDSLKVSFEDLLKIKHYIIYRALASATDVTVTNVIGGDFVMSFSGSFDTIGATVDTAGVTGTMTLDVNKNGTSILTTKISLDSAEKTSRTAASKFVFDTTKISFVTGDILTFDIDAIQTTAAKGLSFFFTTST